MAANTFTGLVNNNWNNLGNWSTGAVPTAADGNVATFDALSPNCTVDGTNRVCCAIDFTNYTNTITFSFNVTVGGGGLGTITLGASMVAAGTAALIGGSVAGTLTSNGKAWPGNGGATPSLTLSGTTTQTLADSWVVDGTFNGPNGTNLTLNNSGGAQTLTLKGGTVNLVIGSGIFLGTAGVIIGGSGNQTVTVSTTGTLRSNLTWNSSGGTITLPAQLFTYTTGTMTYTAGTFSLAGSTLNVTASATTALACNGMTWDKVIINGSGITVTLNENLNLSGLLSLGGGTNALVVNGNTINAGGGIRHAGTSGSITGTTVLNVNAGATQLDGPSVTTGRVDLPLTINNAGTTTIAATYYTKLDQVLLTAGVVSAARGAWASGTSSFGKRAGAGGGAAG